MAHLFTPSFKQRTRVVAALVTMLSGALPFLAGLLIVQFLGDDLPSPVPWLIALASFALGALLPWLSQDIMGLAGNTALRRRLHDQLCANEDCSDLDSRDFVGFSPGERLYVWHGETDRDVGFLSVADGGLVYHGDEFAWSLPRDYVDHIDLTPLEAGIQRIVVRWHAPREIGRTMVLQSREASTVRQARKATVQLYQRLREWLREQPPEEQPVVPLGPPPTDMTGGQMVEEPASGSCITVLASMIIILITIWRVSGAMLSYGRYVEAVLWAGLISVVGALALGYLLHYLQTWEATHGKTRNDNQQRRM